MNVTLLPSSVSGPRKASQQYLTSYVINDSLAIDAGGLGLMGTPDEQSRIKHVLISHTHLDHIASLPIFVENVYEGKRDPVTIYGSQPVLDTLRRDVFNDRLWPDFVRLSKPDAPFFRLVPLEAGKTIELAGLRITPVAVDHVVPTLGFVIEEKAGAVIIASDTGPTSNIWQQANKASSLKAVFLEASFPNAMSELAAAAKHLTPALFAAEARKIEKACPLIAVHIKARFQDQIAQELKALRMPDLEIGAAGKEYSF